MFRLTASHKENVLQLKCYSKVLLIQTFEDIFIDNVYLFLYSYTNVFIDLQCFFTFLFQLYLPYLCIFNHLYIHIIGE